MNNTLNLEKFQISLGTHKEKEVIWICFPRDLLLIELLKQNCKVYWSRTKKSWYALDNNQHRKILQLPPKIIGKEALTKIHPINQPAFQSFLDLLKLKAYSVNTLRTYSTEFASLLAILGAYPVQNLTPERLKSYFLYCINEQKLTENHLQSRINAIKFYFVKVLKRENYFFEIPRPKKPSTLPKVISLSDVKKLLNNVENPKHRLMLKLCYGMGLRVSEIVNLKITHIDSKRMQVLIAAAKGKKDRYVNLPETVLEELRTYYKAYTPKEYLFEGQYGGFYSIRSVQAVFKSAKGKANIKKPFGIHSLRHSYATHLMEQGVNVAFIKDLLGHKDIKTTMLYTHVSQYNLKNIKSPLDGL